jgi:copper chaperone CopZ
MYGDHHVIEVRRILLAVPGVEDVYASSAFHTAEVTYDPDAVTPEALRAALAENGYADDLVLPTEVAVSSTAENGPARYFRHTAAFRQAGVVSFTQTTTYAGRPLWPCPGMGALRATRSEE